METTWSWFGEFPVRGQRKCSGPRSWWDIRLWGRAPCGTGSGQGGRRARVKPGSIVSRGRWWETPGRTSEEKARLFKRLCWVVQMITLTFTYCVKVFGPWVAPTCCAAPQEGVGRRMSPMHLQIDGASYSMEAHVFKIVEKRSLCLKWCLRPNFLPQYCVRRCVLQFRDMRQCTVDLMGKVGKWGVSTIKWEAVP